MKLFRSDVAEAAATPYIKKLQDGLTNLDASTRLLVENLLKKMSLDLGKEVEEVDNYFNDLLEKEKITSLTELFAGERYKALVYLLGKEQAAKFQQWVSMKVLCPYSTGYYRRSMRSENVSLHLDTLLSVHLKEFLGLMALGISYRDLLVYHESGEMHNLVNIMGWESVLAVEIENKNPEVTGFIQEMFSDEVSQGRIRYTIFRAVFATRNYEMYEQVGKLLLAARLQEGLRQGITETMDSGHPEAFIYMLNIIRDNDLLRFSSVKRALGTWTGLYQEADSDRTTRKIFDLFCRSLNEPQFTVECLQSKDALEVYMALWTKAFFAVESVQELVDTLLEEGVKHKLQALFYFTANTHSSSLKNQIARKALVKYPDDDSLVVGYLDQIMADVSFWMMNRSEYQLNNYFRDEEEARNAYRLLKGIAGRIKKETTFSPWLFPWYAMILYKDKVLEVMMYIAYLLKDASLIDDLCGFVPEMGSSVRGYFFSYIFKKPETPLQMDVMVNALGDRSSIPRQEAYHALKDYSLEPEHYLLLEEMLRMKAGDLRQNLIRLLLKQPAEQLKDSVKRLLLANVAEKRSAGLDILLRVKDMPELNSVFEEGKEIVGNFKKASSKEQILIDQILESSASGDKIQYTVANGLGLIEEPEFIPELSIPDTEVDLLSVFILPDAKIKELYQDLNKLIAAHAEYEYTTAYGEKCLFGDTYLRRISDDKNLKELDKYPLAEVWKEFYHTRIKDFPTLFHLHFATCDAWNMPDSWNSFRNTIYTTYIDIFCDYYKKDYRELRKELFTLDYSGTTYRILQMLTNYFWEMPHAVNAYKTVVYGWLKYIDLSSLTLSEEHRFITKIPYGRENQYQIVSVFDHSLYKFWESGRFWSTDEEFEDFFAIQYNIYYKLNQISSGYPFHEDPAVDVRVLIKAYELGLIPEVNVLRNLIKENDRHRRRFADFVREQGDRGIKNAPEKYSRSGYTKSKQLYAKIANRILEIELKRGDSQTAASPYATQLSEVTGANVLVDILKALGKDTLMYEYFGQYTKRSVLCSLLRVCNPAAGDDAKTLKAFVKGTDITDVRLVEAAMYSPQWLEIVEQCIGWKGLYSAAYYFHAHMNEHCDSRKEAVIARFTPINVKDLQLGAFDIDWFKDVYKELGEKRFNVVYESAKYISSGNGHTRGRKYADAVNGKMKIKEVRKEIEAKRNKDLLMSYALIPLNKRSKKDLLDRYQYLQQFLKESKQFGAQRQASEKKAVEIGMMNLARNAGYADVTRLTWSMETLLMKELQPYFTPKEQEGFEVYVEVDDNGKSSIKYLKEGKELKSAPAKLKKNKYVEELKEVHKKLKDQYSRSRIMLEQAMEDSVYFLTEEVQNLTENPVVWPLLRELVFITRNGETGFFRDSSLISFDDAKATQQPDTEIRIAHPVDLYKQEVWHSYQKYLFDKQIRQPFKQVFRELYVKTEEEKPAGRSLRYAGNQIQPQKTVGVLKSRRWIASYEDGLQKVYYKENLVAGIYAQADWFSPSDIEAPTLEWVEFTNRKDYKPVPISEIPDIVFSEVMRDVDLAVSVAHAGGVDPETSHSTIEMRAAIIDFTLPLFRLDNVRLKGSHAFISGTLGDYTVHLGSGVMHQQAGAAINVLPVHSQHRGKLFLPFVDEDPKTAEIISKIILFAEDNKIKDPFILDQIPRK